MAMVILIGLLLVVLGIQQIYANTLAEYTKNFRDIEEIDCTCIGYSKTTADYSENIEPDSKQISKNSTSDTVSGVYEYYYDGKMRVYAPRVKTSFGLPEIGEKSKIGINRKKDKVVYVKKTLKNKVKHLIFDLFIVAVGVFLLCAPFMTTQ